MEVERFEALIDAVIAIIITIIVMGIPLAPEGTLSSLLNLKLEFITYAMSFIVCFNYWNYHQNLFNIVNKIDNKVILSSGVSLFILSFLPYLTIFVAQNFNSIIAQSFYGLDFILVDILYMYTYNSLKKADPSNIELQLSMAQGADYKATLIIITVGYIIGFLIYPPAIIISCLLSIISVILLNFIINTKKEEK